MSIGFLPGAHDPACPVSQALESKAPYASGEQPHLHAVHAPPAMPPKRKDGNATQK